MFLFRQAEVYLKIVILWLLQMRKRHHSGQSPARQYFYLHTAILRRALEFIPTLTTPQFDQFDVPITNISIYTKIYTQTGSFYMHLNSNRPKHKRQNQTR